MCRNVKSAQIPAPTCFVPCPLLCIYPSGGSFVGGALGAWLTSALGVTSDDFSNLFSLVLLCNLATLLPAPFLWLLPPEDGNEGGGGGPSDLKEPVVREEASENSPVASGSSIYELQPLKGEQQPLLSEGDHRHQKSF